MSDIELSTEEFLIEVSLRAHDPKMLRRIIMAAVSTVAERNTELYEYAADMETVAALAMNARVFNGNELFIADKLDKWGHMSSLRWNDHIIELRNKVKKRKSK